MFLLLYLKWYRVCLRKEIGASIMIKNAEVSDMIPQKATALCIYDILKTYTDENHILSVEKIREKLKIIYGVEMERRAVYRNIDALRSMGIEIQGYQENREGYCLLDREFELSEIRLLCDAIVASDMITEDTGKAIIRKLINTQSIFQGRLLQKTVFVKSEKKIMNKQIFYNIDSLNIAINQGCKVSVKIMKYGVDQEFEEREDSPIVISPYVTLWADGNYYIVARREASEQLEHFRIDLLRDIVILERGVDMVFGGINPGQYAEKYILQNGENQEIYEVECKKDRWQEIAEKFGKNAVLIKKDHMIFFLNDSEKITVRIKTVPSVMREWILSHVEEYEVISPKKFKDEIQRTVMEAYRKYCS